MNSPTDYERIAAESLSRNEFTHAKDSRKNTHFNPPRTWPYVVLCAAFWGTITVLVFVGCWWIFST